jgi:hypothetical protein
MITTACSKKTREWTNPLDPESPYFIPSITGTVKNVAGETLSSVTISASGKTTTTNSSGYYSLNNLTKGQTYTVYASKTGYTTSSGASVTTGETKDFTLSVKKWTNGSFSGTYALNFNASTGASSGTADSNTDFDYDGTNFTTPNVTQGILSLGSKTLDSIGTVATTGYTNSVKAYTGYSYAVKTTEGNYVKVYINSLNSGTQAVNYDCVYQSNGTAQF